MLSRLIRWIKYRNSTVQYQLLRQTPKGGWAKTEMGVDPSTSKPTSDDEFPVAGIPGRYRLVERVDGRIERTVWQYETDDTDDRYGR
jgi:hypothetical protein